jgi:hypothetical protein
VFVALAETSIRALFRFRKFGKWRQPEDESLLGAPEAYVLSAAIDGWMKGKATNKSGGALRMLTTSIRTSA